MGQSQLQFDIYPVNGRKVWPFFAKYHYLSETYNGHRAWIAEVDGQPVAFASIIAAPSGHFKRGWRGHRTVVLPQFQGLGLGARLSDFIGHYVVTTMTDNEGRYFSKTIHPRLGEYRQRSPLWKPSKYNLKKNLYTSGDGNRRGLGVPNRLSYAHEYIGHISVSHSSHEE